MPGWSVDARRPWSPWVGSSTLTTSAPSQARASVQDVPASNWVRSTTFTPARAGRAASMVPPVLVMVLVAGEAPPLSPLPESEALDQLEGQPLAAGDIPEDFVAPGGA